MAMRGKMRRVHETWTDSPVAPRATQFDWEQAAVDMEQMHGAHASQRYSHAPQVSYHDDIGPGTGQRQDHALHDQYFAPVSQLQAPFPADEEGTDIKNPADLHYSGQEPNNIIHSPVDTKTHYETGVAHDAAEHPDQKDGNPDWI